MMKNTNAARKWHRRWKKVNQMSWIAERPSSYY